jgi:NhaP-type Na+/H+ or K+/H+ antiporter
MVHWSGIMAIIGCGLAHKRYAFPNLHENSKTTIRCFTEGTAVTNESIIFLLFGTNAYNLSHENVWPFALTIFGLITVFRFVI